MIQNEAEKLKIKESLAKAKTRVQAYNNIKVEQHGNEREQLPSNTLDNSCWMKPVRKDDAIRDGMVELEQERGSVITHVEHKPRLGNTWNVPDDQDKVSLPHKGTVGKEQLQHERDYQNITEMMCELLRQQLAPELDIDIFDGNPMDFHYFMAVFKEVVENKLTDSRGRLTHLIKFTKGEAKEIAKNCIQLPAKVGYKIAKRLLNERFGDPHRITAAYHKEIKQWPQIKAGDADAYGKFQNFLIKFENIDHLQNWNVLNTPDIICMLLSKLPGSARDNWSRKVLAIRRKVNREPEMADFIQFVNDETLIVTNPVFSKEAREQYVEEKPSYKKVKISTFATGNEESPDVCIYCDERHKLEVSDKFMEKNLKERIKFFVKQNSVMDV